MKKIEFKGVPLGEVRKYLSEVHAKDIENGTRAEITFVDGSKQIWVLKSDWEEEEKGYVLKPDAAGSKA